MLFIYWTLTTLSWRPKCPQGIYPCLGPLSHTSPSVVGMEILRPPTNPHPPLSPFGVGAKPGSAPVCSPPPAHKLLQAPGQPLTQLEIKR